MTVLGGFNLLASRPLACFVAEQTEANLPQLITGRRQLVALRFGQPRPLARQGAALQRVRAHSRHRGL